MTDVSTNYGKALPTQEIEKIQAIDKDNTAKSKPNSSNADVNVTHTKETNISTEQSVQEKAKEKQIEKEELENAVASLNQYVQTFERKLDFQLDEESGVTVIKVYDATDEKLIRQIPNEEALTLAQHLNQQDPPQLFSAQV
ncbi:flagellar protein FlaG [Marinicellulosiphila megalodicopiae]|uniref:flagellar protein FlaG n=1 Tax=Marinicellulosiphila megalodicopiae TaxID=2724896 RepID=UPI003BB1CC35